MRSIGVFLALWTFAVAAPRLDGYVDIDGTRLYPDHLKKGVWYIQPAPPTLKRIDGMPAYRFELFRYLGRSGTGDKNLFWARGVVTIDIERSRPAGWMSSIEKRLRRRTEATLKILSAPVESGVLTLMFGDMNVSKSSQGGWPSGPITMGLDATMAQILWRAVEANQTQITVTSTETIPGVVKKGDEWVEAKRTVTYTLPITMDMGRYPSLFKKHDLGGRMRRGYTALDLFDFNFVDELEPGLYIETVEIAIPAKGRPLIKKVRFSKEGPYRQRIRFKLSKRLDRPYRYRIVRVYEDGRTVRTKWYEKQGETLLDITRYKERNDDETH